jgi:NEDD4-like E3 ubiquitin-protein ligase WWP1
MFDNQGRSYFVNHLSKTTQWEDPRRMDSNIFDVPLPNGFEMRYTKEGQIYFYNYHTKTMTFQDPRTVSLAVNSFVLQLSVYR